MDMDMDMDMTMTMSFSPIGSYKVTVVWGWWKVTEIWQYWVTLVAVCILAIGFNYSRNFQQVFVYHWAHIVKERALKDSYDPEVATEAVLHSNSNPDMRQRREELREPLTKEQSSFTYGSTGKLDKSANQMPIKVRLAYSAIAAFNYAYGLLLMLVAMTFNAGIFFALVVGYFLGDVLFASTPLSIADLTSAEDHCG